MSKKFPDIECEFDDYDRAAALESVQDAARFLISHADISYIDIPMTDPQLHFTHVRVERNERNRANEFEISLTR